LGQHLRREGVVVNDKKIRRLQRKYQLFPIRWHSFKIATTDSNHGCVFRTIAAGHFAPFRPPFRSIPATP
jgi:hypothetical protein